MNASKKKRFLIGSFGETVYWIQVFSNIKNNNNFKLTPLRNVLNSIRDNQLFIAVSSGIQILDFILENQFCGSCGSGMKSLGVDDRGLHCSRCELIVYPQISPCIIVLVTNGDKILLANSLKFPTNIYSVLAGFIEAGESAEHACHREVFEEVGIRIKNIKFQGTQSWPFKNSLMIGFRAEYAGGTIRVDNQEIIAADWFSIKTLPELPTIPSISRGLIDSYVRERKCRAVLPKNFSELE